MLGRTARYLIHAGFDFLYEKSIKDQELARRARGENRVLLTRDRDLLLFSEPQRLFLLHKSCLRDHLYSLREAFCLTFREDCFFTRCSRCNRTLKAIATDDAVEEVPEQTREWIDEYFRCPDCERIYWRGTHYRKILNKFRQWELLSNP